VTVGIKIAVEVLDHWRDHGLTPGECLDLLVLAENANDTTRETYGPVHEPYVLHRAAGKSPRAWKNSIGKLMGKKVIGYAIHDGREMRGRTGQWAVYRIADLCPDPPHSGTPVRQGEPPRFDPPSCVRSADPRARPAGEGHPTGDPVDVSHPVDNPGEGHPTGDPASGVGHLTDASGSPDRCEWVTQQVTPNPSYPSYPSKSRAEDRPSAEGPLALAARLVADHPAGPDRWTDHERHELRQAAVTLLGGGMPELHVA